MWAPQKQPHNNLFEPQNHKQSFVVHKLGGNHTRRMSGGDGPGVWGLRGRRSWTRGLHGMGPTPLPMNKHQAPWFMGHRKGKDKSAKYGPKSLGHPCANANTVRPCVGLCVCMCKCVCGYLCVLCAVCVWVCVRECCLFICLFVGIIFFCLFVCSVVLLVYFVV